jgi:hypothetical protein
LLVIRVPITPFPRRKGSSLNAASILVCEEVFRRLVRHRLDRAPDEVKPRPHPSSSVKPRKQSAWNPSFARRMPLRLPRHPERRKGSS